MFHVTGVSFPFFPSFLFSPWEVCALPDGGKDRNCVCKCVENTDMHTHVYVYAYVYFSLIFCKELEVLMLSFPFSSFLEVLCHPSFLFVSSIFWFFLHLFLHTFHLISLSSSSHHHVILPSPLTSPLLITHLHLPQSQSSSPPTHPSPLTQQGRVCVCVCLCVHLWMCTLVFRTELRERESCLWSV